VNDTQERRKPLTDAEIEIIKAQLLNSIYADIGKSVVKKLLWLIGVISSTALITLTAIGKIKWGG
jgi:hypothetical protein